MINIGEFNPLRVIKEVVFGIYLDGGEWGEILVPIKVVPKNINVNDAWEVFIGESKKNFKNAIGYLYTRKEITIESNGISITGKDEGLKPRRKQLLLIN